MGANLRTYYQKSNASNQTGMSLRNEKSSLGNVVILEQTDKSLFLGDIKAGCSQSSLETNMYKAPIFPHKVPPTDSLLVRSAKGKLSIRRIDRVAVVGQQVCAYESMQAGLYRLKHLGIARLTLPTSVSTTMSQLPDEAIALAGASHIERELQITQWSLSSNFVACTNQVLNFMWLKFSLI